MALIDCPNCGHKVSSRAVKCPACEWLLNKDTSENQIIDQIISVEKLDTIIRTPFKLGRDWYSDFDGCI